MAYPGQIQNNLKLSRQILVKVLLIGTIFVAAATVICYYLVYNQSREKHLAHLKQYMIERSRQENRIFVDAHKRLIFFRDEFMKLYMSDVQFTDEEFWKLYFVDDKGATRMKKEYYDGRMDDRMGWQWGISSFIGNNQPLDSSDLKRRLMVAYTLVNRYGPAWESVGKLHVSYPENAITLFYPGEPWGLLARPDLPMNELGTIKATMQSVNPKREPVWTGLYYDETANNWSITYELPVDYEGRHLFNPSFDVELEPVMSRLTTDHPEGGYNFIMRTDGYLVAYPKELNEELKWKGQISLDEIDNPDIVRMYHTIKNAVSKPYKDLYVVEDKEGENYLITYHFAGPDWWFVMVYPKALISREAHRTSWLVLALGFSISLLYYIVIASVVNKKVRMPLQKLQQAVSLIGEGKYDEVAENPDSLPLREQNEIGSLAEAFRSMSKQVRDINYNLESIVESRTKELEAANEKLEELSTKDGLTHLFNRRFFDMHLASQWKNLERANLPIALLMCDIDYFKNYNDNYGHVAGDKCLQAVTEVIQGECKRPSDVPTRYGGEEFAVILPQTTVKGAEKVAENIRKGIEELALPHAHSPIKETVSITIGVAAMMPTRETSPDLLVSLADDALYAGKQAGRDRVTVKTG